MGIVSMLNHKNCTIYCTIIITFFVGVAKNRQKVTGPLPSYNCCASRYPHPNTLQTVEVFNSLLHLEPPTTNPTKSWPGMTSSPRQSDTVYSGLCCKTGGSLVSSICTCPQPPTPTHDPKQPFKWRHFQEKSSCCVYGTCGTPQLPNLEEMMSGRAKRRLVRRCIVGFRLMPLNWISVESTSDQPTTHGGWMRLILKSREMEAYRAVDSEGNTLDFYSPPNGMPRLQFGSSVLNATHTKAPRVSSTWTKCSVSQSYWQPQSFGDATRDYGTSTK